MGSYDGIEKKLIEELGIDYIGISSGKLRRYMSAKNFTDPFRVIKGFFEAKKFIKNYKPDVVFSKGGFVSVPVVLAADRYKVPVIIHESDMTPGLANKIALPHAYKICHNFPETAQYLPSGKAVLTGSPIRSELLTGNKEAAYSMCGFTKGKPVIMVIGGSLGAAAVNKIVRESLDTLLEHYQIVHLCGKGKLDESLNGKKGYIQFEYIKEELKEQVKLLKEEGISVCLAVIQVGSDPASSVYVNNKKKACAYIGIESQAYELPEETTQEELLSLISRLNKDDHVNGILVQLPVPAHMDEKEIIQAISPAKDVDGFHPQSVGALSTGEPGFVSCTPAGIIQLLKRSGISIDGKDCVVVGRSNIVGKPMSMLLLRENGTVTICHSHTKNLKEVCQRADILVAAIGKPKFFDDSYVKDGAVVIDVGIHRNEENKLCGDVDYDKVVDKVSAITPVPGGVGPMTIAMLMNNCVEAALRMNNR